jgi:hypothetical protein
MECFTWIGTQIPCAALLCWLAFGEDTRDQPLFLITAGVPVMYHMRGRAADPAEASVPNQHLRFRAGEITVVVIGGIVATPAPSTCTDLMSAARRAE